MKRPTKVTSHQYRPDIDGLRAIAVGAVIIFHAFPRYLTGGFVGVDIFFVISGFLITQIILSDIAKGRFRIRDFYSRRVRRIFPSLAVVLATTLALGWFLLLPEDLATLGTLTASATAFIINFTLWHQIGYFDVDAIEKPLLHLWSLSIEEQFYLVWPVLLVVAFKLKRKFFVLASSLAIASFALAYYARHDYADFAFFSPLTRFWELLVGALLAQILRDPRNLIKQLMSHRWLKEILSLLSLLAIVVSVLLGSDKRNLLTILVGVLGAAGIIAFGTFGSATARLVGNPISVWIGLISYPLYLWHWVFLSFAHTYYGGTPPRNARIASVLLSITLAYMCYRFLEVHMRKKEHEAIKVTVLIAAMAIIGLLGFTLQSSGGAPSRIKASEVNLAQFVRPAGKDAECGKYINNPKHLFHYCRYSNVGGKRTIAILGDSHGSVAWLGISEEMAKRGINTLGLSNSVCPPFLGTATGMSKAKLDGCVFERNEILTALTNSPLVDSVIVITRGEYYITGHEEVPIKRVNFRVWPSNADVSVSPSFAERKALFISSLQKTVNLLTSQGKKVYVVTENPELPFHPKDCMPMGVVRAKSSDTCLLRTKAQVLKRQAVHRKILQSIKGATFIDTLDVFCPTDTCLLTKNGVLLYSDDDHVSVTGSRLQAREITKYIK